jgi:hypothetical protein
MVQHTDAATETKQCRECKRDLPVSCYYAHESSKDRLQSRCKECQNRLVKELRASNPEYYRE